MTGILPRLLLSAAWLATVSFGWTQANCQEPASNNTVGQLCIDGRLVDLNELRSHDHADEYFNRYDSVRSATEDSLDGHLLLAHWCQSNDLPIQAEAHLKRALIFDPENAEARTWLRHVNVDGRWYSRDEIANIQQQAAASKRRLIQWEKPVTRMANLMMSTSPRRQRYGLQQLESINDPESITALETKLADTTEAISTRALQTIAKFHYREATDAILRAAIFNRFESVRRLAVELLRERNRYDYVPPLMEQLVTPWTSRYQITSDSRGNVLYQFALLQKEIGQDRIQHFQSTLLQNPRNRIEFQPNLALQAMTRSQQAQQIVANANQQIENRNDLIRNILAQTTGAQPGDGPEDWWQWWYDENEVTIYERPVSYTYIQETEVTAEQQPGQTGECLVAGTPIWTSSGPAPIESLMTGDQVLCLNIETRELQFKSLLVPTRRPSTPVFRIELECGETITASGGHLFHVAGEGWTKVRNLRQGMRLGAVQRKQTIRSVQHGGSEPLYNLIIDGNSNYFVGNSMILSHDSTIRDLGGPSLLLLAGKN